ncbi:MAG: glycerophosphodiester phosphodiesterase [Balneolaceae bacterium]
MNLLSGPTHLFLNLIKQFPSSDTLADPLSHSLISPRFYHRTHPSFAVIAHRGASHYAPENTMTAFRLAHEMKADMIELDVSLTSDGVPVVLHDSTLNRTTTGSGPVMEHTLQHIQSLDAGRWFSPAHAGERVPTLEEVLAWAKDTISLNIEIKREAITDQPEGGVVQKVLDLVRAHGMERHVILSGFDYRTVEQIKAYGPEISAALLYDRDQARDNGLIDQVRACRADGMNLHSSQVNSKWLREAKKHRVPVWVYTVNRRGRMKKLIRKGVSGIFTNRPDLLREVVLECLE